MKNKPKTKLSWPDPKALSALNNEANSTFLSFKQKFSDF